MQRILRDMDVTDSFDGDIIFNEWTKNIEDYQRSPIKYFPNAYQRRPKNIPSSNDHAIDYFLLLYDTVKFERELPEHLPYHLFVDSYFGSLRTCSVLDASMREIFYIKKLRIRIEYPMPETARIYRDNYQINLTITLLQIYVILVGIAVAHYYQKMCASNAYIIRKLHNMHYRGNQYKCFEYHFL